MYLVKVKVRFHKESYRDFVLIEGHYGEKDQSIRKNWEDVFVRFRVKAVSDKQAAFFVKRFYNRFPSVLKFKILSVDPFIRGYQYDESL